MTKTTVVIEYMPCCHRASHRAAGNHGSWPANGAQRLLADPADVEDDDEWVRVVRTATARDLETLDRWDPAAE